MTWRGYRLGFRLRSPVHAGMNKIGNLQRTRRYVPARTMRGAFVAQLARVLGRDDHRTLMGQVDRQIAFGYFYAGCADGPVCQPYQPTLASGELRYAPDGVGADDISEGEFDHLFLTSWASTALALGQGSALDGSLHEVECLVTYTPDMRAVWLVGRIYINEDAPPVSSTPAANALEITLSDTDVSIGGHSLMKHVLPGIQVGGERRYGFGHLEPVTLKTLPDRFAVESGRPFLTLPRGVPFPAHVLACDDNGHAAALNDDIVAGLEVLLGRETAASDDFGARLSVARVCWAPGGYVGRDAITAVDYRIEEDGVLRSIGHHRG